MDHLVSFFGRPSRGSVASLRQRPSSNQAKDQAESRSRLRPGQLVGHFGHFGHFGLLVFGLLVFVLHAPAALGGTITLQESPDRWVAQRSAGVGVLQISGTLTGPGGVEARAVDAEDGAPITAWSLVDASPSGSQWSGALGGIPEGGWYRVEARLAAEPSTFAASANTFGVGLVVAAIGQSNMVKMFTEDEGDLSLTPPFETPSAMTWRYGYGEPAGFEYARPRTVDVPVSWGPVTGTGGIRLANGLALELGVPVLMLDFALDWTGIDDHWNNDLHRSWQRFSEALDLVGDIGVVIWHQGAYDAHENLPTVASYKAGLDSLYQRITDRVGGFGSLPMLVAIQNRGDYDLLLSKDPTYDAVRQAQREWIAERGHGFAAGDSIDFDITTRPGTGNGHFWAREYQAMADRMARGVLHATGHPGFELGVDGPSIAQATIRGTTVQVQIAHDHGTLLRLEQDLHIEGFTLTDGEWLVDNGSGPERNHLPIASARLSDDQPGNWVEIELGASPAGPVKLRYLYGQNPFYGEASSALRRQNGNTLYDDFAYHPDRSGLPVSGTYEDLPVAGGGAIVISAASLDVPEGGSSSLDVSLSDPPGAPLTVVATIHGDGDVGLVSSSLVFDDGNYSTPQTLEITAGPDADTDDGSALLRLTAPGHHGALVTVEESDGDPHLEAAPAALEVSRTGGLATFEVTLGTAPAGPVVLDVSSGDPLALGVSPATLTFGPGDWQTPQTVTVEGLLAQEAGAGLAVLVTLAVDTAASDASYDAAPPASVLVDLVGLDDGLILHWPLDEMSGTVAGDASGHGHHGAIGGDMAVGDPGVLSSAMASAGPGGSAGSTADGLSGPGLAGSALLGAGLPSASLDELSVSFWYRLPAAAHAGYLFTWGGSYNRADTISLYLDPGDEIRVRVHDAADSTSIESVAPAGFDDSAWHHLAVVKDASGSRVYLDGALALSSTVGDGAITPSSGVTLGMNEVGKYGVEASFDDLRIYGRALGDGEIQGLVTLGGGELTVDLLPAAAASSGAQWRVESDSQWRSSGETVSVAGGLQTITFNAPAGWLTPADQPVQIAYGESTQLDVTFVQQGTGTLSFDLQPTSAGGQWKLLGDGLWRASGELVSLPAGHYDVAFSAVPGWVAPADATYEVVEGETRSETAYYIDAATADPIAHLALDEISGSVAFDLSGNGQDGLYGGDMTLGADGVFGAAATTHGEGGATGAYDDGLRVNGLAGGSYDQTSIAFWYRLPVGAHSGYLMTWGGSYKDPSQFSIYYNEGQHLRVRVHDAADTSSLVEVAPPGFDDASWHHVVLSKGPAGTSIYFDGQLIQTHGMGQATITPPAGLRLGANENGQWGLESDFDDLKVWARELTPPEIEGLFEAGNRGSLTVDLLPAEATASGAQWRLVGGPDSSWQGNGARLDDVPAGAYTVEFDAVFGWITPVPQAVTVGVGEDLQRLGVYALAGGPILEWRLDESSVALDSSGNGRNGILGNDVQAGIPGLLAQAVATAGTGTSGGSAADAVVTPDFAPDDVYLEATVSLWYRLDVIHDGYLFSWGGSFNDPDHFSVYLDPQSGLRYRAHDAGDSASFLQVSPPGFADGGWHHVALVKDSAGSRAYFDGVQVATSATMGLGAITPQGPFTLGANTVGTFGIEASFDEVAVWERALGDVEIQQLFAAQGVVPLTVDLAPAQAVVDGGRWRLIAGADTGWHQGGETVWLPPGPHTVTFEDLSQWRTPADVALTAVLGSPIAIASTYRSLEDGQVRVDLSPAMAVTAGAEWRLVDGPDGGLWRQSGDQITVPAGAYTLELAPAAGYLTPDSRSILVPDNDLLVEPVAYSVGGGPILNWPLDAANPGQDIAGFGRHATVGSRVAVGLGGVAGGAVQTAGLGGAEGSVDDGLETADFDTADAYDEATVALWYRLPAQPHDGYLFAWGGSNNDPDHLSAFMDAGTELRIRVHDSLDTASVLSVAPPTFDDSAWHHVAVVKDVSGSRVYFDGALVASHIMGSGTIVPVDGFFLGLSEKGEFGLEATFDEVKVWDRALSDLEVSNLFIATPPPVGFGGAYRTVDDLEFDLLKAAADFPAIVEVLDYGDSFAKSTGGHTTPGGDFLAGDDLLAARVTNRSIGGDKPLFVLMACLHAREIATPELAMRLLDELTEHYGSDADVTWLVDHHEVWILPLTNPDGHRHVELGADPGNGAMPWRWRKNVRPGGSCGWPPLDGSSTEGVDLNRNFPFEWGTASGQAGSSDPCSENYRGASAGSEPETAAIMSLIGSLIPDQRGPDPFEAAPADTASLFVQLHSPFRTVSWPWAYTDTAPPNAADLQAIGEKLASIAGYASGQTHDAIYRMTGTADDWVYGELGAPALLLEVGEGLMPPYHKIDNILWPEVRDAFVHAAKIARAPYQLAHGPDINGVTADSAVGGFDLQAIADESTSGGLTIAAAEAYVEVPPWDQAALAIPLAAADGAFDETVEDLLGFLDTSSLGPGQHLVWVRAQDSAGHWGPPSAIFIDVP